MMLPTNPKADYLARKDEIDDAIHRVLDSGWYIMGQEVVGFEEDFANFVGVQNAIGTASGTDALHLALRACGIGPGDAVITVSHTAVATVAAIELAGALPVLVDINPVTFTIDPERLEQTVRNKDEIAGNLKAIIPVHLYGHPCQMSEIKDIAERNNLYMIEDCAQSHGAVVEGRKTGAWGHMAAFSFYPTKNLGALGDGGMVVANDSDLAEQARLLREYGWKDRYISSFAGLNTRLDELQAAVLRVKLRYLDEENARRRELAQMYDDLLSDASLNLPALNGNVEHVYHQYVIRSAHRDDLRTFLQGEDIGTLIHYPVPVHLQPAYQGRVPIGTGGLNETEQACQEILSLPMHPRLSLADARRVGEAIVRFQVERQ